MVSIRLRFPLGRLRFPARRRATATLLALAIEALIVLMLIYLTPVITRQKPVRMTIFGIQADTGDRTQERSRSKTRQKERRAARDETRPAPKPVETHREPQPDEPRTVDWPPGFIAMSRSDFAASDVGRIRGTAPARAVDNGGDSAPGDSAVAGQGPHGETLYAADWYTRPTHAQLQTYMPPRAQLPGWGLIACRTVANYRVEDCQELGESPRGSGLAGAVRQAAWQFRVRPPRVGGKALIGTWVSIRIDYTLDAPSRVGIVP